ncbi:MAG: hypothetical protein IPP13_22415 [Kouleothrix sp.]|jgi:hypothetical protein|nr:hypothetical protein [Kouleothrix sp.]
MSRTISHAQADEIVQLLGYDGLVDDSEVFVSEQEYRYFPITGSEILVIGFDGSAKLVNEAGEVLDRRVYIDFEEVGPHTVRYWHGSQDCGAYAF